jgi:hypothetical protein
VLALSVVLLLLVCIVNFAICKRRCRCLLLGKLQLGESLEVHGSNSVLLG